MIRKLRIKFIATLMSIMTLFLVAMLLGLYAFNRSNFQRTSWEALRAAATDSVPLVRIGIPLAVVDLPPDGAGNVVQNRIFHLTDFQAIQLARETQALPEDSGTTQGRLRYLSVDLGPAGTRYAFADTYMEQTALRAQAVNSLLIGLGTLAVFFVISVLLARWMVRPVEAAWDQQRRFVADASHDLRTPLTAVLSNVNMLIDVPGAPPEKIRRRLDIARTELLRMKELVEQLLVLARSDGADLQKSPPVRQAVDLSYLITCSAASFEPVLFDAGKQLDCRIDEGLSVLGDGEQLRALADILLDNACKYSLPGSTISLRLAPEDRGWVRLTVENPCAPISREDLARMFERFYRLDKSRGESRGYGLGLAIAKGIAEAHRGTLRAEGGDGAVALHLRLPRR